MDTTIDIDNVINKLQESGWKFEYDPKTRFIEAHHPNGGRQSVCEMVHSFARDSIGFELTNFLNGKGGKS